VLGRVNRRGPAFLPDSVHVEAIREDQEYGSRRIKLMAMLGNVRIPLQDSHEHSDPNEKVGCSREGWFGQYRPTSERTTEHHDLAVGAAAVPQSVICLAPALRFHDIGTQLPSGRLDCRSA
jgi:hypothetical protein